MPDMPGTKTQDWPVAGIPVWQLTPLSVPLPGLRAVPDLFSLPVGAGCSRHFSALAAAVAISLAVHAKWYQVMVKTVGELLRRTKQVEYLGTASELRSLEQ